MTNPRPGGGHRRPGSSGFERYAWFFMRLSGVVLLGLAVFHLFWMHFHIGVGDIDFQTVVNRWNNPLWRVYDFALLAFALTHGMNGLRSLLGEYIRRPRTLMAVKTAVFLLYFVLATIGAYVIFTFQVPAA